MESHDILREAFKKCGVKSVAAEMKLSLSLVYKWAQPGEGKGSGVDNPLDRVVTLVRMTNDFRIIQWLCQQVGGYFVHNPKKSAGEQEFDLLPTYNEIIQQFADLLQSITVAASDESITADESDKIRRQWDELKAYTEGFVRCCEEGDFEKIRHPAKKG